MAASRSEDAGRRVGREPRRGSPGRPLTWRGRAAGALLGLHAALLFLPPLPPYWKGSLWSYLLAYSSVLLACLELPRWTPRLARRWRSLAPSRRSLRVYGTAGAFLTAGAILRFLSPDFFARFSR